MNKIAWWQKGLIYLAVAAWVALVAYAVFAESEIAAAIAGIILIFILAG